MNIEIRSHRMTRIQGLSAAAISLSLSYILSGQILDDCVFEAMCAIAVIETPVTDAGKLRIGDLRARISCCGLADQSCSIAANLKTPLLHSQDHHPAIHHSEETMSQRQHNNRQVYGHEPPSLTNGASHFPAPPFEGAPTYSPPPFPSPTRGHQSGAHRGRGHSRHGIRPELYSHLYTMFQPRNLTL